MSLFKVRDWWSTSVQIEGGGEEECDLGCLLVANINNAVPAQDKLIVGGFSGTLRIFVPQSYISEDGTESSGFRPDHVMLEASLNSPIINLAAGKFIPGSDQTNLCILHPDRLTVCSVIVTSGQAGHGDHSRITTAYQHMFQNQAYSFVIGPFGGIKGKDFIAVESLDGFISVYEQESFAFSRSLPGFLLPGPLAYVAKSDSFLTVTADFTLQSYKYHVLAVASDSPKASTKKVVGTGGKRVTPEWTFQLGEAALDIRVTSGVGYPVSIVVLTHRAVFCFKENGVIRFVKKLEFNPSSFFVFPVENSLHICMSSHTGVFLIYKDTELKWAAKLTHVPVAMTKADLKGITGALVTLSEAGHLEVSFLGTDPSLFVAPPVETREINYDQTDKEMADLHKIIRASTKDSAAILNADRGDSTLSVTGVLGTQLETWHGDTHVTDADRVPAVPAVIRLMAHSPLNSIRVSILVEKPIGVTQDTFVLRTVADTSQLMVKFYLQDTYIPCNLCARIVTSYTTSGGAPRIIFTDLNLPLRLVVKLNTPSKEADHKLTISMNKPAVSLMELYPEFELDSSSGTALGLQYYGGSDVTILSSKTTNRYRLQSDSLPSLWIILKDLTTRLKNYWSISGRKGNEELVLSTSSALPLHELFNEIDAHFLRRRKHVELQSQLVLRATQFRAVQRRLLTKFKDKTPTPLTNLDNLLEGTYKQILQMTDVVNDNLMGLESDSCTLSCILHMVLELARLQCNMNNEQFELLSATLSPVIQQSMEQGWEEVTNCCLTFLLRSIMGKNVRESPIPDLVMLTDTSRLKKHIGLLLDKFGKADMPVSLTSNEEIKTSHDAPVADSDDTIEAALGKTDISGPITFGVTNTHLTSMELEENIPIGSRLGEDRARSARIRSARISSAQLNSARQRVAKEKVAVESNENVDKLEITKESELIAHNMHENSDMEEENTPWSDELTEEENKGVQRDESNDGKVENIDSILNANYYSINGESSASNVDKIPQKKIDADNDQEVNVSYGEDQILNKNEEENVNNGQDENVNKNYKANATNDGAEEESKENVGQVMNFYGQRNSLETVDEIDEKNQEESNKEGEIKEANMKKSDKKLDDEHQKQLGEARSSIKSAKRPTTSKNKEEIIESPPNHLYPQLDEDDSW